MPVPSETDHFLRATLARYRHYRRSFSKSPYVVKFISIGLVSSTRNGPLFKSYARTLSSLPATLKLSDILFILQSDDVVAPTSNWRCLFSIVSARSSSLTSTSLLAVCQKSISEATTRTASSEYYLVLANSAKFQLVAPPRLVHRYSQFAWFQLRSSSPKLRVTIYVVRHTM